MGAVAWTSSRAQADHYESERVRQSALLEKSPDEAKTTLAKIYAAKGFSGELLDRIVATISGDRKTALATIMNGALGLEPADDRSTLIVGISTIAGSFVPLIPFFLMPRAASIFASVGLSAVDLFLAGAYEAKISIGDWRKKGLQMALIGLGAAFVGYLVGKIFGAA